MIDESCLYCDKEGECTKGLPGTPCEVAGCVAHSPVGYLCWNDMTDKEKSKFLWDLSHLEIAHVNMHPKKSHIIPADGG